MTTLAPRAIALALLAAALAGCSKPGDRLVGTWDANLNYSQAFLEMVDNANAKHPQDKLVLSNPILRDIVRLDGDGKCTWVSTLKGKLITNGGTWSFEDSTDSIRIHLPSDPDSETLLKRRGVSQARIEAMNRGGFVLKVAADERHMKSEPKGEYTTVWEFTKRAE